MISWIINKLSRQGASPEAGMFLGLAARGGKPILLDDSVLRSHVALSGRGGQGRSTLLRQMLAQQTVAGRGWVHIDPSGDDSLRDHLASVARDAGRLDEFYVLDLVEPVNSNTYDVLRAGSAESRARRVLTVFPEVDKAGAEYFHKRVGDFFTLLFNAIDASGMSVGLFDVSELLTRLGTPRFREQFLSKIPANHPTRTALSVALDALELDGADARRLAMVCGAAAGRLAMLAGHEASAVFNHPQPEIDFTDVLANGKMCLVRLSGVEQGAEMASLGRMVLQDICTALHVRASMPAHRRTPFLVALDGFPSYGLSESVTAPIGGSTWAQARGLNVSLVPVVDSGSWDQVAAGHRTEQFVANTFTKVYFQRDESEQLVKQHADLPAGALPRLLPGQFLMCKGRSVVAGQLRYTDTGTPPGFKKQPMPSLDARPRIVLPPV